MARKNGVPPKPPQLKALTGGRPSDLQKRVGEGVKTTPGIPIPPEWLDGEALAEWHRLVAELDPYGLVSLVDRGLLAMLASSWGLFVESERILAGIDGVTNEHDQIHPSITARNQALNQYYKIATEFGMSPSIRSRVAVAPKKSENVWAKNKS